jgi:stress response protein YsnF
MPQKLSPRGEEVLPLVEEQVHVSKRQVTSRVRVTTVTDQCEEIIPQDLVTETIRTERVAINRVLEPGEQIPQTRTEGDVTIVPVFEEIVVVARKLVLVEEIHLHRERTTDRVEHSVTLRKQRAVVERIDDAEGTIINPMEDKA